MMNIKKWNLSRAFIIVLCAGSLWSLHAIDDSMLYKEAFGFSGPVREITHMIELPSGAGSSLWEFSEDGYITRHKQNDEGGSFNEKKYSYDALNRLTEYAEYQSSYSPNRKEIYEYSADGGKEVQIYVRDYNAGLYLQKEETYNRKGERLSEIQYSNSGKIIREYFITRDGDDRREEYHHYDYDGKKLYYQIRLYDSQGRIVSQEQKSVSPYTPRWKWEYNYDNQGRISVVSFYIMETDQSREFYWKYSYAGSSTQPKEVEKSDGSEHLLEHRSFFYSGEVKTREKADIFHPQSGELLFSWEYTFDHNGNTLESVYSFHPAPFSFTKEQEFTAESLPLESALYNDAGYEFQGFSAQYSPDNYILYREKRGRQYERTTFEYDEQGRQISSTVFDREGEVLSAVSALYDEYGSKIKTQTFGPGNQLYNAADIEYVYDDYGNWIESRTYYTNNIKEDYKRLQRVEKRNISYYSR